MSFPRLLTFARKKCFCGCFPLAIYFTFGSVYMSMPLAQGDQLRALCPPRGVGYGVWGEGDARGRRYGDICICICIADSLCYKAETNTPL